MTASHVEIRLVSTIDEYVACEELQYHAWQMADYRESVPLHMLLAGHKAGGVLLGAFAGAEMVGFCFGIPAIGGEGRPYHYSHMLGVHPAYQGRGVGRQLKEAQREAVLAQGLDRITWTYDPLETRNAHLNIARLGVVCCTYLRDLYGPMADGLNAGLPTDRFQVDWWISSDRVARRLAGLPGAPVADAVPVNRTDRTPAGFRAPDALVLDGSAPALQVEVPADYQAIKAADPDLAMAWRLSTRRLFETYFAAGYAAVSFRTWHVEDERRSAYVLARGAPEARV
jgi:predicted GNAT superfamily acetyltransferase